MKKTKYQLLIDEFRMYIKNGTFRPGERLPSIRKLAREKGCAVITVLQAYGHLEEQGLVYTKHRSGYFVEHRYEIALPRAPIKTVQLVLEKKSDLLRTVHERNTDPLLLPLGGASLSLDLLPVEELRRRAMNINRKLFNRVIGYENKTGAPELRLAIVKHFASKGIGRDPENCIVTNGGTEALYLALRAVIRPGDVVAVESPCYFGLLSILDMLGASVLEIPTEPENGINIESLEEVVKERRVNAMVLHPCFQNPLGSVMPDQAKKTAASLAAKYKVPLIEADTTGDLYFGPHRSRPIQSFSSDGWVLSYGTFSKLVSPGFRLGYLFPGRFSREVTDLKHGISMTSSTAHQLTLASFLRDGGYVRHIRRTREFFEGQLARCISKIAEHFPQGTRVTRPTGGYLLWVELPHAIRGRMLWQKALDEKISITPGELFSNTNKYDHYIRINCGSLWNRRLEEGIKKLGSITKQLARSR